MIQEKRHFSSRIHPNFCLVGAEVERFPSPVHEPLTDTEKGGQRTPGRRRGSAGGAATGHPPAGQPPALSRDRLGHTDRGHRAPHGRCGHHAAPILPRLWSVLPGSQLSHRKPRPHSPRLLRRLELRDRGHRGPLAIWSALPRACMHVTEHAGR